LNGKKVGLTGLEPVTLRLSSACSNQLSYRPVSAAEPPDFGFAIIDFRFGTTGVQARIYLNRQSQIANRKINPPSAKATRDSLRHRLTTPA
jgi:hypothetical protein